MTDKEEDEYLHMSDRRMQAELNKVLAETFLLNKKLKWYEVVVISSAGAVFAGIMMAVGKLLA